MMRRLRGSSDCEGAGKPGAAQLRGFLFLERLAGLGVFRSEVGDRRVGFFVVGDRRLERDVLPAQARFHLDHLLGLDVQLLRDLLHFVHAESGADPASGCAD